MTFKVGTLVDVVGRKDLTHYGKIVELQEGGQVVVHFQIANRPRVCAQCGIGIMLSLNAGTGEVECMRSGCGYRHGFDERNEIIPLDKLIDIDEKRLREKKENLHKKVSEMLNESRQQDKLLTKEQQRQVIELLDTVLGL